MFCMFNLPNMSVTLASCQRKCVNQMTTPEQEDLLLNLKMEKEDLASMLTVNISDGGTALKNSLLSDCNRFVYRDNVNAYRLRNTENKLVLPQSRTNYLKRCFS